jgi:hypothetical protein
MKRVWFKAKNYGWGWYPATWQGWLTMLVYVGFAVLDILRIDRTSHSDANTLVVFIPDFIILTALLIVICWRTGEKPKWRWGGSR